LLNLGEKMFEEYKDLYKNTLLECEEITKKKLLTDRLTVYSFVSNAWTKENNKTEEEFIEFYKKVDYVNELALWHSEEKFVGVRKMLQVLEILKPNTILDFGGGIGTDSILLCKLGYNVTYFEINEPTKSIAIERFKKHCVNPKILEKFPTERYDAILLYDMIGHFKDVFSLFKS